MRPRSSQSESHSNTSRLAVQMHRQRRTICDLASHGSIVDRRQYGNRSHPVTSRRRRRRERSAIAFARASAILANCRQRSTVAANSIAEARLVRLVPRRRLCEFRLGRERDSRALHRRRPTRSCDVRERPRFRRQSARLAVVDLLQPPLDLRRPRRGRSQPASRWLRSVRTTNERSASLHSRSSESVSAASSIASAVCDAHPAHPFVTVSSRFRITLATVVHAASSAASSFSSRGDSPTRSSFVAAFGVRRGRPSSCSS